MPERLSVALERAHRSSQMTRVEVGALTPDEARELLGDEVDIAGIYEESGGNPFYLEQLTRSAGTAPAGESSLTGIGVPSAVSKSVSAAVTAISRQGSSIVLIVPPRYDFDAVWRFVFLFRCVPCCDNCIPAIREPIAAPIEAAPPRATESAMAVM